MRKAKVNELVRSFAYVVRTNCRSHLWPWPIFEAPSGFTTHPVHAAVLVPFVSFAYSRQSNYILAGRNIALVCSYLRDLSSEEQFYAASLMLRFYVGDLTNVTV